jgi:hypothetical protein
MGVRRLVVGAGKAALQLFPEGVRHGVAVRWEAGACFLVAAALVAVALRLSGMWAGAGLPSCG